MCSGEISCSFQTLPYNFAVCIFKSGFQSTNIILHFILNSCKSHVRLWSLDSQPQADLEDPLLNPSLWPPSNLVFGGEGFALPALAVAALVANVVLLRFYNLLYGIVHTLPI